MSLLRRHALMSRGGLWTPANLSTPPALWVDDTSAVTDAGGGACSQWNDRSGNNFHLTQSGSSLRPQIIAAGLNGKRTIRFDGSSDILQSLGARNVAFRNVSAGWIFGLYKKNAADVSAAQRSILHCSVNSPDTAVRASLSASLSSGTANAPALGARRLDGDGSAAVAIDTINRGTDWVLALAHFNWATRTGTLYVNGAQQAQTTTIGSIAGPTSDTAAGAVSVGAATASLAWANVELAELMAGWGYLLTSADVDRIFGSEAWKWGLQGNLAGGHPYASAPP